jgi:CRP-like cAMP-binding protein
MNPVCAAKFCYGLLPDAPQARKTPGVECAMRSSASLGQTLATLKRVAIFADLSPTEFQFLAERAVPRDYAPGEVIFVEGETCDGLLVVETGHVRIFKSSPGGREQVLAAEGPGRSVAELLVFDGGNCPATTTVADQARVYFISKQGFYSLCLVHDRGCTVAPFGGNH